jgi:deoxycytidylate deaminase
MSFAYDELLYKIEGRLTVSRVKYWMRVARLIEESENPCYSRKIGVVIVNPLTDTLVSVGHNSPPKGSPPCDDPDYLENVVWPQLTEEEKTCAFEKSTKEDNWFVNCFGNCGQCPRKLIGALSGKRLELCVCAHAEHNAIINAGRDLSRYWMICHCGIPCVECVKSVVNSGISTVVCLERSKDYSPYSSRYILKNAGVNLIIKSEEYFH